MHTRTIEVTPTDQGDGTTLAQRDEILRASMAGVAVGPVTPLAAAKSEVEENRQ